MKHERLFEILMLLLQRRSISAKELAAHFEVSVRTIYRDINALSAANIPIYTTQGIGGGIALMEEYVLPRAMLSPQERIQLMDALQCLKSISTQEDSILSKLSSLFQIPVQAWLQIDFQGWSDTSQEKNFQTLQTATLQRQVVTFSYINALGEKEKRRIEPHCLLFKQQSWYVRGYDEQRKDFRTFKITRMQAIEILNQQFIPKQLPALSYPSEEMISCRIRVHPQKQYRALDELQLSNIKWEASGALCADVEVAKRWYITYFLSYGDGLELLSPKKLRQEMKQHLQAALTSYLK